MPACCAVADCKNISKPGCGFHHFPLKNAKLCKEWVRLCKRKDKFKPKNAQICSSHFTPENYERDLRNELLGLPTRKKLKKDAVPSIFPERAGKSLEELLARKERALNRKWVVERKAIVQELLNRVEEEEQEDAQSVNCGDDPLEPSTDDFLGQRWEPPQIRTPSPPPPEPEPDYFELTIDDFKRKVDSLWKVLIFKNKKISFLERRIDEMGNVLKQNQLDVMWVVPPEIPKDEPRDPLGDDEEQNFGSTSTEYSPNIDKSEQDAIAKIEDSLTEFCQYNNIHLQTLDVIKSEVGMQNLVQQCQTKIPNVRLERIEYTKDSNTSAIHTSCSSPVEFEPHHGDQDQDMPAEELPVNLATKWMDNNVTKVLYSYRCNKCTKVCPSLEAILRHNQKEHKAVEACSFCKTCGSGKYDNHSRYKSHEKTSTNASFVRFVRKVFKPPMKDSSDDPLKWKWRCEKCNETFKTVRDKLRHKQEVHRKKWKCERCKDEFTAMNKLRIHMKEAHRQSPESPLNKWKCKECEETFPSLKSRMLHMRENHKTKTLPEKTCPHCNRIIRGRYQYKLHIQRHVGERSFLCSKCGFTTTSKSLLKSHTDSSHADTELEYPHICMYCGRSYKSKVGLRSHERVHAAESKHTCPICHKEVALLKSHINEVHNMIPKYACHLCDQKYKRRSPLNEHLVRFHKQPRNALKRCPYPTKGDETFKETPPKNASDTDKEPETTVRLVEENQEKAESILDKKSEQVVRVLTEPLQTSKKD